MTPETPQAALYLILDVLQGDAESLSTAEFASRHGEAFFVHRGPVDQWQQAARTGKTMILEPEIMRAGGPPSGSQFLVFPLRSTGRSPFPNFISVGRTHNNDVVIEDASLSKFHAYVRRGDDGQYSIQDAGSKNGTKVDGRPVPVRDKGEPVLLNSGCGIQLGGVRVSFVDAAQLRELANRVRRH